jgi:hypothetical protein
MTKPVRYESIQEPLGDEERLLMDQETWDWDSIEEGVPVPNSGAIPEIHLTRDEVARIEPVAHAEGLTLHEFIKQAALARLPQEAPR